MVAIVLVGLGCVCASGAGPSLLAAERGRPELVWIMVDVTVRGGVQGDAHLLLGGQGTTVLIDAGEYASGRDRVVPLLKALRVRKLDAVFITHHHFDHMGGVLALLDANVPIGAIYTHETTTRESCATEPWGCRWDEVEGLRARARERGIPVHGWSGWSETAIGSARLVKIAVFEQGECPAVPCDMNDTSLIARLEVGGRRVLFTGDLNRPLSDWLVRHRAPEIAAEFLKVPHHGTEGTASNEFFQAVQPRLSFVPSPTQLWCSDRSARIRAQLAKLSDEIFVSDAHGDVFTLFYSDGSYAIKTTRNPGRLCA